MTPSLIDDADVQQAFAAHLRHLRKQAKLSRDALAERSGVPASTIKKFELTGQISFRQLLFLWQSLDDLRRLYMLTRHSLDQVEIPSSIDEVLSDEL
jgi:transcriptional regulator with XRE-family HTH domain